MFILNGILDCVIKIGRGDRHKPGRKETLRKEGRNRTIILQCQPDGFTSFVRRDLGPHSDIRLWSSHSCKVHVYSDESSIDKVLFERLQAVFVLVGNDDFDSAYRCSI